MFHFSLKSNQADSNCRPPLFTKFTPNAGKTACSWWTGNRGVEKRLARNAFGSNSIYSRSDKKEICRAVNFTFSLQLAFYTVRVREHAGHLPMGCSFSHCGLHRSRNSGTG